MSSTDLVNPNGFILDFLDFLFKTRSTCRYQVMLKKNKPVLFQIKEEGCGSDHFPDPHQSDTYYSVTSGLHTLQGSILSVYGPPRLHFKSLMFRNFNFNVEPGPGFHSNNEDPGSNSPKTSGPGSGSATLINEELTCPPYINTFF